MTVREQLEAKYGKTTQPTTTAPTSVRAQLEAKYGKNTQPTTTPVKTEAPKKKGFLQKASDVSEKTFGGARDLLFGTTGKTVGSLFTNAIGSGAALAGKDKVFGADVKKLKTDASKQATPGNIAFTALELYPGGGQATRFLKKVPGGKQVAEMVAEMPNKLRASAIKQYSKALGATTKELKKETARVVPGLLKRKVAAPSLEKLAEKAGRAMEEAGTGIREFEESLGDEVMSQTKPVIERLEKLKSKYIVEGKVVNPTATKAIDEVKDTVAQFGDKVSTKSLIKVRRILDESVDASRGFLKDKITNISDKAEKEAADAIREVLAADLPDMAKLNAEFSFWNKVKNISKATVERKSTQSGGLSRLITTTGGAASGFASGDSMGDRLQNAVFYGFAGRKFLELLQSPGYKMLSANTKNKLAETLAKGGEKEFDVLVTKLLVMIKNQQEDQK